MTDYKKKLYRLADLSSRVCDPYWQVLHLGHKEHGDGCAIVSAECRIVIVHKQRKDETDAELRETAQALCDLLNEASC